MQAPAIPVATTGTRPDLDNRTRVLILDLAEQHNLTIREATRRAAIIARDEATAKGWAAELVDLVVIRTVELGAQLTADLVELLTEPAAA